MEIKSDQNNSVIESDGGGREQQIFPPLDGGSSCPALPADDKPVQ